VKNLVTERLLPSGAPEAGVLGRGEGGIVSVGGRRAAAFRDEEGTLHAVSAVCTHLGC
jgi:Rieske Fe-S protein